MKKAGKKIKILKGGKRSGLMILAMGAAAGIHAQGAPRNGSDSAQASVPRFALSLGADGWFPTLLDPASAVSYGLGGTAQLSFAPIPFVEALTRFGFHSLRLSNNESILYMGGSAGLGLVARLYERYSLGLSGFAGLGRILNYRDQSFGLYELGVRLEAGFRLTAAMTLGLSAGYERLANPNTGPFLDAVSAGVRLKIFPSELGSKNAHLSIQKIQTQAIFPVFRSWYDAEPFGSVTIRNNEDGPIEQVRVSFMAPEYMGGPRLCSIVPKIERGGEVTVPLYAVFDERILNLTENSATSAEIDAEYTFIGTKRSTAETVSLSIHHRNAMSWEDDRRAAAFVSPTDPSTLWFARYATSIVRDRMRDELPPNMQYALGIFEALKLYGLSYVVDPNSSYIEMSENAAVVDYLQYPSQTLMYRGGDCDDISILFCSLLESAGIDTAFITIPGHIFMAFDLGLSEAAAREQFFDPGLLLFKDGRTWAPVEITMVKDGFVKAWRIGAKQWIDNEKVGSAQFYPMRENWIRYKPSGLQNAEARFALPDEARTMVAFDTGIDRFMAREIEPIVKEYERRLSEEKTPEVLNEYGMAMARVGMLDPAWERFAEASRQGYPWAWNNLASIAYVRRDYELAYSYYEYAAGLLPGDPVAILGMARCAYELDRYSESTMLYAGLKEEAPAMAESYSYLASAYGGAGRAWSMADRLNGSVWSKPGLVFKAAAAPAAPVVAAAAPVAAAAAPAPVAVEKPASEPAAGVVGAVQGKTADTAGGPTRADAPSQIASGEPTRSTAFVVPRPEESTAIPQAPGKKATETLPQSTAEKATVQRASAPLGISAPPQIVAAPKDGDIADKASEDESAREGTIVIPTAPITILALALPPAAVSAAELPAAPKREQQPTPAIEPAPTAEPSPGPQKTYIETPVPVQLPKSTAIEISPSPVPIDERPDQKKGIEHQVGMDQAHTFEGLTIPPLAEPIPIPLNITSLPEPEPIDPEPSFYVNGELPEPKAFWKIFPEIKMAATGIDAAAPIAEIESPDGTIIPMVAAEVHEKASTADIVDAKAQLPVQLSVGAAAQSTDKPALRASAEASVSATEFIELSRIDFTSSLIKAASGSWTRSERETIMTDAKSLHAKLVMTTPQTDGPTVYEFTARSLGSGWVGFGLHLHGQGKWSLSRYGGGDSILVWITSDPKNYGDTGPRLQVYRSIDEVAMDRVASIRIEGSCFESRKYRIEYDPVQGFMKVWVDGKLHMELDGLKGSSKSDFAALRALDRAEFSDFGMAKTNSILHRSEPSNE